MYQHVFFTLKDKQIYTTKRKHPRQEEIGCIFVFQKGAVYSNMNEKPLFFLLIVSLKASIFSGKDFPMHQLKKNLNRFDLILYMVLFLGVLAPLLFTGWQMGLFRKPIGVDAAPLVRSNSRVLRVAIASDFAPHSFLNKEGQLSGMDVEVLYDLANRMQCKPEFFTGDWPTCRKMMQDGEVDVLSGLDIYSNMPGVIKTIPTSADTMQVFGKKPVNHVSQLSGKRVAIMKNSVLMTSYDFNCTYVEYPTNTSILAAVEGGDVDYGISHGAVAQDIIQKNHFNIKPGLMLLGSYPAFGISKDRIGLRDEINNYLRQMSHDGTLKNLQEKWMEDYTMDRSLPAVYHRYHIFYIAYTIAFLVFAGVMYLYRKYVRRQSAYIDALLAYQNKLKSLVEDQFSHQDSSLSPRIAHTGEDGIRGFHVLVVDNNTLSQEILIATLKDAGATASTTSSGKAAIRAFEKSDLNTFDAILMDLVMPGMDGFATAKAIRALPRVDALTIPIIAVTANTYQDIEDEVHAAGMNACLSKPVHTKALIAALEQYKL